MNLFNINNILFEFLGVKMSYLEFYATISGLVAVILSVLENVWSWMLGLINVVLAFVMFYQIQLYPDMFLQVFFFITNIIGFLYWKFPKELHANLKNELKISKLSLRQFFIYLAGGLVCTYLLGTFAKNLSELIPQLFSKPSAFPYLDSFTTVMSIFATFLLIRKKVEAWWMWLAIDIISTYMYFVKEVKLYSLLYAVFCVIALLGAINWTKEYRKTLTPL
jgi:nicotinamide mononucleotide transporter